MFMYIILFVAGYFLGHFGYVWVHEKLLYIWAWLKTKFNNPNDPTS